jgi:hypothetical protein
MTSDYWELTTGSQRHTGVLEKAPSSEAALEDAHGTKMTEGIPAMRYFSRITCTGRKPLSKKDAIVLAGMAAGATAAIIIR